MCVSLLLAPELHQSFVWLAATAPEKTLEAKSAAVATMQVYERDYIFSSILFFNFRKMSNVAL